MAQELIPLHIRMSVRQLRFGPNAWYLISAACCLFLLLLEARPLKTELEKKKKKKKQASFILINFQK